MVSFPQVLTDLRLSCVLASGLIEINLGGRDHAERAENKKGPPFGEPF
jgi:hypothetical protein